MENSEISNLSQKSASLSQESASLSQELELSASSRESTPEPQLSSSSNSFHVPFKNSTHTNLPLHSNAFIKNPTLGGVRKLKRRKTTIINNYYNITADSNFKITETLVIPKPEELVVLRSKVV
ncbi:23292_t:CDS:2 [Gigaspora rosea]|nr:23292_t:CDS:2 [Gigaspora rosea]